MANSTVIQNILDQTAQAQKLDQLARLLQSAENLKAQASELKVKAVAAAADPANVALLGQYADAFTAAVSTL